MKTNGPGKYDAETTIVRVTTGARGVLLMVVGGERGNGFSVQGDIQFLTGLPAVLRHMAKQIEADGLPIEKVDDKEKADGKGGKGSV